MHPAHQGRGLRKRLLEWVGGNALDPYLSLVGDEPGQSCMRVEVKRTQVVGMKWSMWGGEGDGGSK